MKKIKRIITFGLCLVMCFSIVTPVTILASCSHKSTTWVTTSKPTCTTTGTKVKKCKSCGKILKTEKIAKTTHAYRKIVIADATCTKPMTVISACTICKDKASIEYSGQALGHKWGKWKKNPTTGKYFRGCSRCGKQQYK